MYPDDGFVSLMFAAAANLTASYMCRRTERALFPIQNY